MTGLDTVIETDASRNNSAKHNQEWARREVTLIQMRGAEKKDNLV